MKLSRRSIIVLLLIALAVLGYGWSRLQDKAPAPLTTEQRARAIERGEVEYTNFVTNYSVILPEAWPIEDISQPVAAFLNPTGSLESGNEQSLYEKGAFSLQVVNAKLETPEAFLSYVHGPIESGLRERSVEFTGKETKAEGFDAYELSITKPYPLTQLIVNGPLVTRLTYQKKPKDLSRLLTTLAQTSSPSGDSQAAVELAAEFLQKAKDGKAQELYDTTTSTFQSKISADQFKTQISAGKERFGLPNVLVSMLNTKDSVSTRSVLVDQEGDTMNRVILSFKRENGELKIDGVSISNDQKNTFTSLAPANE